ncbi:MAG: DNA cytosine methyltransferase [Akkermansiaceae bacterium]|nr:DNA cytosine methyltransferase [Armatimonadota bacterium]
MAFTCIEICSGAGGQSLGIEEAGFEHLALVDDDPDCCATLRINRPGWNVIQKDVREFTVGDFSPVDLFAGGVPCPPFSVAGKQLGCDDERDLFPQAIRLIQECRPRAIMLENVRGFLDASFAAYRTNLFYSLESMGYRVHWKLLNASHYNVPQLRPRVVIVGLHEDVKGVFQWPDPVHSPELSVGNVLYDLMAINGWKGVDKWRDGATGVAPTLVGGSKKHGGPDLGPTRAKQAWAGLGVNGHLISKDPPHADFEGMPMLTVRMAARIQGFPDEWQFAGKKTSSYRQVGNAFPPPVASAVARAIASCLS